MKIAVTEKTEIEKVPRDTTEIHLVRPIKKEKLDALLSKFPITKITLSNSCLKRLPRKAQQKLKDKGIGIILEKRRGRALDLSLEKIQQINELRKDYQSIREIEKVTGIPKSTVHYLLKYADRGKVRKGSTIIY
ncbi:MAG: hypothetical protein AABW59_03990, partial [archaeon]